MEDKRADRFNEGKCRLGMIPLDCHKWEADGFAYGANKYAPNNWRKGLPISEQMDSLMRHLNTFFYENEDIDPESKVHHLGLAQCNLSMMVNTLNNHPELDDRFKPKESANKLDEYIYSDGDLIKDFEDFLVNNNNVAQKDMEIATKLLFEFIHKNDN